MKRWGEMATLRPSELARLIDERPIVYLPAGIYEWHDAQNPMGTDTLKMLEICRRAARGTGGVVHMPSYVGIGPFTQPVSGLGTGGLNFSAQLIRAYLIELFGQLEQMGFELIVLLYGHTYPENINLHEAASIDFMCTAGTVAKVLCLNDLEPVVRHRYKVADHAAKWETSFMLASQPDRVDMTSIPPDHGEWHGLDPREHASAAEGERMYGLIAQELTRIVDAAFRAPRSQLVDDSFLQTGECWEQCQNYADLSTGYWGGDERWEDPYCFYCVLRAPGVVKALVKAKGEAWVSRRIQLWDKLSAHYTGRPRRAWQALKCEMEPFGSRFA